jgi:hypothetical protein
MVDDAGILETVERYGDNLDRVTKQLVAAANRGGGEDNITVVAFSIGSRDAAGDLGDTAAMEPVTLEPEDATTEDVSVHASSNLSLAGPSALRVRIVLGGLVLLAIVTGLLVWELTR